MSINSGSFYPEYKSKSKIQRAQSYSKIPHNHQLQTIPNVFFHSKELLKICFDVLPSKKNMKRKRSDLINFKMLS
jgi:hypothetical protein